MRSLLDSLLAMKNWVGIHNIPLAGVDVDPSWCCTIYLHGHVRNSKKSWVTTGRLYNCIEEIVSEKRNILFVDYRPLI
jgi:hypothetical protein